MPMEYVYPVTYMKCQTCTAKTHCDQCAAEAEEALRRSAAVEEIAVDLQQKVVRITGADEDTLLDLLEGVGLFAD